MHHTLHQHPVQRDPRYEREGGPDRRQRAGAGADESAAAKKKIMRECGVNVVDSPADIGTTVAKSLNSVPA